MSDFVRDKCTKCGEWRYPRQHPPSFTLPGDRCYWEEHEIDGSICLRRQLAQTLDREKEANGRATKAEAACAEYRQIVSEYMKTYSSGSFHEGFRRAMAEDVGQPILDELGRLREEVVGLLQTVIFSDGHLETEGKRAGWWDTMALSHVRDAGDRLVELGQWERSEDGYGRRWWYRECKTTEPAEKAKEINQP